MWWNSMVCQNQFAKHMIHTNFGNSYISFRLDTTPKFVFIGVYVLSKSAPIFNVDMFADVGSLLVKCREEGLFLFIGGDFNSRPREFTALVGKW